jgi:hypothetical protein
MDYADRERLDSRFPERQNPAIFHGLFKWHFGVDNPFIIDIN